MYFFDETWIVILLPSEDERKEMCKLLTALGLHWEPCANQSYIRVRRVYDDS